MILRCFKISSHAIRLPMAHGPWNPPIRSIPLLACHGDPWWRAGDAVQYLSRLWDPSDPSWLAPDFGQACPKWLWPQKDPSQMPLKLLRKVIRNIPTESSMCNQKSLPALHLPWFSPAATGYWDHLQPAAGKLWKDVHPFGGHTQLDHDESLLQPFQSISFDTLWASWLPQCWAGWWESPISRPNEREVQAGMSERIVKSQNMMIKYKKYMKYW